jgi:phosphopantothenoylcysteine decarboxylase/phosphopantothenate--cysteine ligase
LPTPAGVDRIDVETALQMAAAVEATLPVDAAVMVAAVADWRVAASADQKIKKQPGEAPPPLLLTENPDILKTVGHHEKRPKLVVGFAAETQDVEKNGRSKLERKGADLIVANDVSPETGIMGGTRNRVKIISAKGVDEWPEFDKDEVAERLATLIASKLG